MALAVSYFTQNTTSVTTSAALYTTSSTAYNRDLVIANGSAVAIFVNTGPAAANALTTASFEIPAGQQVVLMGQVPTSMKVYVCAAGGQTAATGTINLGWASVVSVI